VALTQTDASIVIDWLVQGQYPHPQALLLVPDSWPCHLSVTVGPDSRRLWRANACLESLEFSVQVEAVLRAEGTPSSLITAIDLGAGTGRDACFLAKRGWRVLAVDREVKLLGKLERFMARSRVDPHMVRTLVANIKHESHLQQIFASTPANLVVMSRFKPADDVLVALAKHFIPPGCFVVVHHFLQGATSRRSGLPLPPDGVFRDADHVVGIFGPANNFQSPPIFLQTAVIEDGSRLAISFMARKSLFTPHTSSPAP
jgi:SAM-dependent methyltransferase